MGQVLGGCHQVYVICPLVLETEENLAQFLSGHLPAEVPAADFMILAEAAAQGTAGKKDGAAAAIRQMIDQTGAPVYQSVSPGLLAKGVIIRHMVLPGQRRDSIALLEWISGNLPRGRYMISLMSQYTPYIQNQEFPELNRRITSYEYDKVVDAAIRLGLTDGFMQEKSSAREEYTPPFDLEGL